MLELEEENVQLKENTNEVKNKFLWTIHNLKFLFIPGYQLEDLNKRRMEYELKYPKVRRIRRYKTPLFFIGITLIFFLCTIAVFQEWISPYTFIEANVFGGWNFEIPWYAPPSPEHPLGQTFLGFDILARIIYATRPILLFTVGSTLLASVFGILIGSISGYYGGWFDVLIMRIMDIILSFPGVIFAIICIAIWGADFLILILIYSIIGIPYFARLIRTDVMREKELPYINAGKVAGAKNRRIIFRHILPNCMQTYIIATSYNMSRSILSLAILGFLRLAGIGWIEWGSDLALVLTTFTRYEYAPWAVIYPSLMILISVLGFLLLGDSLSDIGLLKHEKL